ncbi:MAG: hypothetical protein WDZ31_07485 [Phycisphaeraceae bacterium]
MAKELLPAALGEAVGPPNPEGGNDFTDDRLCLCGLIFILQSGVQYNLLRARSSASAA